MQIHQCIIYLIWQWEAPILDIYIIPVKGECVLNNKTKPDPVIPVFDYVTNILESTSYGFDILYCIHLFTVTKVKWITFSILLYIICT